MGIICELYRIPDPQIEKLEKLPIEGAEDYLSEKYASVNGQFHIQNDTVFSLDKGWAITKYLIQKCDQSDDRALQLLNERFIKSIDVKRVNSALQNLAIHDLKAVYSKDQLIENHIYQGNYDINWNYINDYHFAIYKAAFARAAILDHGIAVLLN